MATKTSQLLEVSSFTPGISTICRPETLTALAELVTLLTHCHSHRNNQPTSSFRSGGESTANKKNHDIELIRRLLEKRDGKVPLMCFNHPSVDIFSSNQPGRHPLTSRDSTANTAPHSSLAYIRSCCIIESRLNVPNTTSNTLTTRQDSETAATNRSF